MSENISHQLMYRRFNPIGAGGGGGEGGRIRGPDDQTHSRQSESSYSMTPKLGDF